MGHINAKVLLQPGSRRPLLHQSDQTPPNSRASAAAVRPSPSWRPRTSMPAFLSSLLTSSCFIPCNIWGGNCAQCRDDPRTSISQATSSRLYLIATCSPEPSIPSNVPWYLSTSIFSASSSASFNSASLTRWTMASISPSRQNSRKAWPILSSGYVLRYASSVADGRISKSSWMPPSFLTVQRTCCWPLLASEDISLEQFGHSVTL